MIETTLYARLSGSDGDFDGADFDPLDFDCGTGAAYYPVRAKEGTQLPIVIFSVTNTVSLWKLSGPSGRYWYDLTLDCHAINEDRCRTLAETVVTSLEDWQGNGVRLSQYQGAEPSEEEHGYHYNLTFRILS